MRRGAVGPIRAPLVHLRSGFSRYPGLHYKVHQRLRHRPQRVLVAPCRAGQLFSLYPVFGHAIVCSRREIFDNFHWGTATAGLCQDSNLHPRFFAAILPWILPRRSPAKEHY